jgi:hypothetical protein
MVAFAIAHISVDAPTYNIVYVNPSNIPSHKASISIGDY